MLSLETSGRSKDQVRKHLHCLFEPLGLKITIDVCNPRDDCYQPYRKTNNDPLYINSNSNHPSTIIKQIPILINKRLSHLSPNKQSFESCRTVYENALKRSNYQHKLYFLNNTTQDETPKRKRSRNVIWFNLSFSKNAKTNIDTHFPQSSTLYKNYSTGIP